MWKCRHINNSVIRRRCFAGNNKTVLAINDANLQHTIEATKYNRAILHPQCNFSGSYLRHSRIKCVKFCFNTGLITSRDVNGISHFHIAQRRPFRHYNVSRNRRSCSKECSPSMGWMSWQWFSCCSWLWMMFSTCSRTRSTLLLLRMQRASATRASETRVTTMPSHTYRITCTQQILNS